MNFEQIIKLIDAGYTKADIDAMQAAQPASDPEQPNIEQPASDTEPLKDSTAPVNLPGADADNQYKRLEAKLNQLIGLQQSNNINSPIAGSDQMNQRGPTDILGSVIAPPRKERNK